MRHETAVTTSVRKINVHRAVAVAACVAVLAGSVVGCAANATPAASSPTADQRTAPISTHVKIPTHVKIDASWATYYTGLRELRMSADLIVLATVVRQQTSLVNMKVAGESAGAPASEVRTPASAVAANSNGYLTTDFELTVQGVLANVKGLPTSGGLVVTQTGGIDAAGTVYETDDDPLFKVGDKVVLFLIQYAPGNYKASGGPSGRFSAAGGIVNAIVKNGVAINNVPITQFIANVAKS